MNHTLSPGQPRDHLFDNIKALMLFLVPLGIRWTCSLPTEMWKRS